VFNDLTELVNVVSTIRLKIQGKLITKMTSNWKCFRIVAGRIAFSFIVFLFAQATSLNGQNYCPVNFDGNVLNSIKAESYLSYGKIFACNGNIIQVEKGYRELPYFLLQLDNGGTIWVSGQLHSGFEVSGARVRVMGFLEKAAAYYKPPKVNKDPYHLVAIVLMDISTRQLAMRPGQERLVQEWIDGKIPDPGKTKK
jgi:hypothetical protein